MTTLDGWTHDRWGSAKMLFIEAGLAMASAVFFALLAKFLLGPKPQTQLL
jgi:hypothetical protein